MGQSLSWQARGGRVRMYDSPLGHWALTGSRPSADVTLIPLRVADLAAALPGTGRVFDAPGWGGKKVAFLRILRAILIPACHHVSGSRRIVQKSSFSATC